MVTFSVPSGFSVTVHAVSLVEPAGAGFGLDPDVAFRAMFPAGDGCPPKAVTATAAAPAASAEAAAQVSLRLVRLTGRAWRRAGEAGG
jgi:hypothetical protein